MAATLAVPSFRAGPNDQLAAVDVYTQKSNTVVNANKDVLAGFSFGSVTSLLSSVTAGGRLNVSSLVSGSLSTISGSLGLDPNGALAKVMKAATPALTSYVNSKISSNPAISKIVAQVGAVSKLIEPKNWTNAQSVTQSINTLTGGTGIKLIDSGAANSIVAAVASQGISAGIPGVIGQIKGANIPGVNWNSITQSILPTVNKMGDTQALKALTADDLGKLPTVTSSAITDFSSAYPTPTTPVSAAQYQANYTDITSTFTQIKPDWLSASRTTDAGTVDNAFSLADLQNPTPEFSKTLQTGALASSAADDKLLLLCGTTPSATAAAANLYPAAFTATATAPVAAVADPRSVVMQASTAAVDTVTGKVFRIPGDIIKDITATQNEYATRMDAASADLYAQAAAAGRAGDAAKQANLIAQAKAAEETIAVIYRPRIQALKDELNASMGHYSTIT